MRAYFEIYTRLKAVLEASAVEINTVGFWADSVNRHLSGDGLVFQDKGIFIELPNSQPAVNGSYHQNYLEDFDIRIHAVVSCIDRDFANNFLYAQEIHEVLAYQDFTFSNENGGFSELNYVNFAYDPLTKDKFDMVISYRTKVTDSTTRREKRQIPISLKHVINKDIVDNLP